MFSATDRQAILAATGEDCVITRLGVTVKTIRVKFRTDFEAFSPYDEGVSSFVPSFLCDPLDLSGTAAGDLFTVRGDGYVISGPLRDQESGFTRAILAKS